MPQVDLTPRCQRWRRSAVEVEDEGEWSPPMGCQQGCLPTEQQQQLTELVEGVCAPKCELSSRRPDGRGCRGREVAVLVTPAAESLVSASHMLVVWQPGRDPRSRRALRPAQRYWVRASHQPSPRLRPSHAFTKSPPAPNWRPRPRRGGRDSTRITSPSPFQTNCPSHESDR